MSTITLKNVPDDLHRSLKSLAKAHGRSLNREIIATLENSLHGARVDTASVVSHARAVRETMGVFMTHSDLKAFKNEGRK
ncbi:MAG: Arc family DNA-binding protein [Verrucomicrobia bacterium]|nr:Arc family DNA-binding protein [Verrucomicrobiota bacterium]